ncbi:efflux RND transporter periplasmic adaptor subunit [Geothrix sp. 21YS21S-4]|uniref:efflux RND transporter periplasmic adaptor subunit n=1 Tax=Geothrix sp. 21YS21S-4 TaxID=3068889 RepID=UPI0027B943E0|nr:efflux RND transporter periplasmic adaptor subunit [Geothrix sp. 21YS21S-4]
MSERAESPAFKRGGIITVLLAAGGVAALLVAQQASHRREAKELQSAASAGPLVRTAKAVLEGGDRGLVLQGESLPYVSTTLYAKVSGFLRSISVDKGSAVAKGQTIAVVEAPETDRDIQALQADADNKRRNAERSRALGKDGLLSPRDAEQAEADARVAEAKLASEVTLKGYEIVRAPFAGVITQRFADPGALIQNGGSTSSAQPLVSLAQVDRLRVTFYLDASVAAAARVGTGLDVRPVDHPEVVRSLTIARLSGALDPKTRTLLAEADLDNRDGAFLPGGFVQVTLKVQAAPRLTIPEEALTQRDNRALVAVVQADGRVRFQQVQAGTPEGQKVRVLQGLKEGEVVLLDPPPALKDGDRVQVPQS